MTWRAGHWGHLLLAFYKYHRLSVKLKSSFLVPVAPLSCSCNVVPRHSSSLCLDACEVELKKYMLHHSSYFLSSLFTACRLNVVFGQFVTLPSPSWMQEKVSREDGCLLFIFRIELTLSSYFWHASLMRLFAFGCDHTERCRGSYYSPLRVAQSYFPVPCHSGYFQCSHQGGVSICWVACMIAQQHPRVYKRGGKENILISTQQNQTLTSAFCYFQKSVVSRSISVLQNI